jgi:glutaconate CoA-transferase subunit A
MGMSGGNFWRDAEAAFAAEKVILTCEEIVDHDIIVGDPNRTVIPGFVVASVVHEPHGSFPSPTQGYSRRDDEFYFEYHQVTRSRAGFEQWLRKWVLDVEDHPGFLSLLGQKRIERLKPEGNLFAPVVSFNY